jgi:hypothetical protein
MTVFEIQILSSIPKGILHFRIWICPSTNEKVGRCVFTWVLFFKNYLQKFKYIHFSTGKYKNCSCLTNLHAETLAARGATLPPLKVQTGVAVKKTDAKEKNTAAEGLTVREGEKDVFGTLVQVPPILAMQVW